MPCSTVVFLQATCLPQFPCNFRHTEVWFRSKKGFAGSSSSFSLNPCLRLLLAKIFLIYTCFNVQSQRLKDCDLIRAADFVQICFAISYSDCVNHRRAYYFNGQSEIYITLNMAKTSVWYSVV